MSNFIVSARKYRPARFEEVLGQEQITYTLKNALRKGQLAHSFLFSGPRGVGKTTCARILAKVVNCEQPTEQFEPCGSCDSCQAFVKNASFNIFEMDGASNNGVQDILNLMEQVRVPPYTGKYKVYIIDEVHMLSTSAFNAFLKTLEEPPDYAIFILATTEKHKILPTILSRCQIYDFNRIGPEIIVKQLQQICELEGIEAEEDALHLIGVKADGAMRDALSIFDRISSFADKKISYKDVIQSLHILDFEHYFRFTDAFLTENLPQVMTMIRNILDQGFDVHQVILGLADHFRDLLMAKFPKTQSLILNSGKWKQRSIEQTANCSQGFLLSALDILNQADVHYPRAENKQLHLEMALAKITYLHRRIKSALLESPEKKTLDQTGKSVETPVNTREQPIDSSETPPPDTLSEEAKVHSSSMQDDDPSGVEAIDTRKPSPTETPNEQKEESIMEDTGNSPPPLPKQGRKIIKRRNIAEDKLIPRISRLDHLQSKIEQEEKKNGENMKGLSLDKLQDIWMDYAEQCSSPSISQTLKQAVLSIEGKTVNLEVGTQLEKNIVLQETPLMDSIRRYFNDYDIALSITVQRRNTEDKPLKKAFLSDREKYEIMVKENPELVNFVHRFDMKFSK